MNDIFDPEIWAKVPFHFWSVVFFALGAMVGSFLNVCVYRMPLDLSVVCPPSHCPQCKYQIPWYLNVPLVTWTVLRGKCANCGDGIPFRYFGVELLTGVAFLGCWLMAGGDSALLALAYCLVLSGFIVATFIDFDHFIIPDQVTLGGMGVGFLCSLAVPGLHDTEDRALALERSFFGIAIGAGVVYAIVRVGKLLFGRQQFQLEPDSRIVFTETALVFPDHELPYEDIFYRKSDTIVLNAKHAELIDRCYPNVEIRLSPTTLKIGKETYNPEEVGYLEVVTDHITIPREAMGLGDVKFMGAIGAFLGWQSTVFSLMISSVIGAMVGISLILFGKREWSSRIPYGPYIALAAVVWIFMPGDLRLMWTENLRSFTSLFSGRPDLIAPTIGQ